MRRVIVQEFVSLDGLASGPGGSTDFIPAATQGDQSFGDQQLQFIDSIDAILLGRTTYELFASYWPEVTSGDDKPFADKLNAIPKIVFSRSLEHAPWGSYGEAAIVRGSAAEEVVRLKNEPGKDMVVWGSLALARSLLQAGLVDEVQLVICPSVVGSGKRLFGEDDTRTMKLLRTSTFDQGGVLLAYT